MATKTVTVPRASIWRLNAEKENARRLDATIANGQRQGWEVMRIAQGIQRGPVYAIVTFTVPDGQRRPAGISYLTLVDLDRKLGGFSANEVGGPTGQAH
jgi:hypothetical protein